MRYTAILMSLFLSALVVQAQECVQIESILVDACTLGSGCNNSSAPACNCEGKNEMLRFSIGDQDQNVASLLIDWPNNGFQGICQDAQTALNTAELNATIEACGYLVEPENGLLPAFSQVLVVTSADMCTASNSFANLSDTLIVLYQCPGNYQGHFANHGSGFRTTIVSFGGGCTSTATYNRALLVTQAGAPGAEDGATVNFPAVGQPIYYNDGCIAPVPVEDVDAGDPISVCPGETFAVAGSLQGDFSNWFWSGGSGTFSDANALETTYTPGPGETESFTLTLNAENCNGVVSDELEVTVIALEDPEITPEGPLEICPGESIALSASGTGDVTWNTGDTGNTLDVTEPGTYTATFSSPCGETSASVTVSLGQSPALEIQPGVSVEICPDDSVELTAAGDGELEWSTGETTASITVDTPGSYTVTLTNDCGTASETVLVTLLEPPSVAIQNPSPVQLCEGAEVQLEATGEGDFAWSTGETDPSITVAALGLYTVTLTNTCGSDEATIEVVDGGSPPSPSISIIGNNVLCPGESTILVANTDDDFIWNTGDTDAEIEVFGAGTYTLTATNACGSGEANILISQITAPLVTIAGGDTVAICDGNEIVLSAASTLPITWSDGSTGTLLNVDETGTYYATVSNICGSDTAFVEVLSGAPEAGFTASTDTGSVPLEVVFTNTSSEADSYLWSLDGEPVGDNTDLVYTFTAAGVYELTLLATDAAGCTDTYSLSLDVTGCPTNLFIPNTFTPNGDGINDLFSFVTQCVESYELRIYNRWGTLIYTGEQGSPFWDGNNGHGAYVSNGVYLYVIRYNPLNGAPQEKNGTITIFR